MRRFKLEICYDGSNYSGWQIQKKQPNVRTIQEEIEKAILQITGETVSIIGSGRTDAGVHALYQVAAFSAKTELSVSTLTRALNATLPRDIRIWQTTEVSEDFHPIFDIIRKRYRYLFSDEQPFLPFYRPYVWHQIKPLDLDAMKTAASFLLGTHDFRSFETQGSPRQSSIRTIFDISVERMASDALWSFPNQPINRSDSLSSPIGSLIALEIEADGFLYNMVRAIAGTLARFGQKHSGFEDPNEMKSILDAVDRQRAGPTAPPFGLYMIHVAY